MLYKNKPWWCSGDVWEVPGCARKEKLRILLLFAISRGYSYKELADYTGSALSEIGMIYRNLLRSGTLHLENGKVKIDHAVPYSHFHDPRAMEIYDQITKAMTDVYYRVDAVSVSTSGDHVKVAFGRKRPDGAPHGSAYYDMQWTTFGPATGAGIARYFEGLQLRDNGDENWWKWLCQQPYSSHGADKPL